MIQVSVGHFSQGGAKLDTTSAGNRFLRKITPLGDWVGPGFYSRRDSLQMLGHLVPLDQIFEEEMQKGAFHDVIGWR